MKAQKENIRVQQWVVGIALLLFAFKVVAYYLTGSVAILTDALESTVNVVAGFIGLYSLHVASKPKDHDHPYGHGKAEFLSAAVEGTLIILAGFFIIYESLLNFIHPHQLKQLDTGLLLVAITAAINYITGWVSIKKGKSNKSLALIASGKHLQSDTYSTLGLIAGLALIYFTGLAWLDSAVALVFAFIIIYTGYSILRSSIAGIMDEADKALLASMITLLNKRRPANWIDLHNLRVIKYGGHLHIDCHLTVPWYLNVNEAHQEIDVLNDLIRKEVDQNMEIFVHSDGCMDFSCAICEKKDCFSRKSEFRQKIEWTMDNILSNQKHRL